MLVLLELMNLCKNFLKVIISYEDIYLKLIVVCHLWR